MLDASRREIGGPMLVHIENVNIGSEIGGIICDAKLRKCQDFLVALFAGTTFLHCEG